MPLYIDLHIDSSLTLEEVRQCHIADKEIQEKYGVRYLQVLLNQPQGYLFCLVEGPDKETCAKVHQQAHGNVACNVLEITESDFSALLNGTRKDGNDVTITPEGQVDAGVRTILNFSIIGTPARREEARTLVMKSLTQFGGINTESLVSPSTVVFNKCASAIQAGMHAIASIDQANLKVELRQGISLGMPLERTGNYFEDARKLASYFTFFSERNKIGLSRNTWNIYNNNSSSTEAFQILNPTEEKFLIKVFEYLNANWNKGELSIEDFADAVGVSKSQLTRKLKLLTPLSPNDLIKEYRLRKSVQLMRDESMNVAEVTMAVGFSNPSYFTKCFRERFGAAPTEYLMH